MISSISTALFDLFGHTLLMTADTRNTTTYNMKNENKSPRKIQRKMDVEIPLEAKRKKRQQVELSKAERNAQNRLAKIEAQKKQTRVMIPHPIVSRCYIELYIKPGEDREIAILKALERAMKYKSGNKHLSRRRKTKEEDIDFEHEAYFEQ